MGDMGQIPLSRFANHNFGSPRRRLVLINRMKISKEHFPLAPQNLDRFRHAHGYQSDIKKKPDDRIPGNIVFHHQERLAAF